MARRVVLEWPIQHLSDSDDEPREQVGTVNNVHRESERACLVSVVGWDREVWFPRKTLRIDDDGVIWAERQIYEEKEREK